MSRQQGLNESERVDSHDDPTVIDRIENLEEMVKGLETNKSHLFSRISRLERCLGLPYKGVDPLKEEPRRF